MIAVVNVGTGNIRSIFLALLKVAPEEEICVTANPAVLKKAKKNSFSWSGFNVWMCRKIKKQWLL
jgi:imidazoleglycerol phosphate synthase glutamine amidotransferase subunit HisH